MLNVANVGDICVYKATGDSPMSLVNGLLGTELEKAIATLCERVSELESFSVYITSKISGSGETTIEKD